MPTVILFGLIIIVGLIALIVAVVIVASKKNQGKSICNSSKETCTDKKFCRYCGTQIPSDSAFCTNCGSNIADITQTVSSVDQTQTFQSQPYNMDAMQKQIPMNWFKFLIYFSFFAGAAMNAITAIMYFTGAYYQGYSNFLYGTVPELKTLDMLMCVLNIGLAVFAIIARFKLSGFKKSGPMYVYLLYAANALVYVVYMIGIMAVFNKRLGVVSSTLAPSVYTTAVMNIVICCCMIFVNHLYFKKRKFMFTK